MSIVKQAKFFCCCVFVALVGIDEDITEIRICSGFNIIYCYFSPKTWNKWKSRMHKHQCAKAKEEWKKEKKMFEDWID